MRIQNELRRFWGTAATWCLLCAAPWFIPTASADVQNLCPPPECGEEIDADIYIMLDRTGSTSQSSRDNEADAAKVLLNFFDDVHEPPEVAIGAFGCSRCGHGSQQACTHKSLSSWYGDDDHNNDGDHFNVIDEVTDDASCVGTHYVSALTVAGTELATGSAAKGILIFLSDGGDQDSFAATVAAADALKAGGVEIFAILFGSPGEQDETVLRAIASDPVDPQGGHPGHFFNAPDSGDLDDIVQTIVEIIGCDDQNSCTDDTCNTETGFCEYSINYNTETECCDPATGEIAVIDDGNACTEDACNVETGEVTHTDTTPAGQCCDPETGDLTPIDDNDE